jgi:copper chaperone CopZ
MKASAYFKVEDIKGNHGIKELKRELDTLRGVTSVSISPQSNSIAVDYDTTGESRAVIQEKIEQLGFTVLESQLDQHIM